MGRLTGNPREIAKVLAFTLAVILAVYEFFRLSHRIERLLPENAAPYFADGVHETIWIALLLGYVKGWLDGRDRPTDGPTVQPSGNRALQSLWNIGRETGKQYDIHVGAMLAVWLLFAIFVIYNDYQSIRDHGVDAMFGLLAGVGFVSVSVAILIAIRLAIRFVRRIAGHGENPSGAAPAQVSPRN